MHSLTENTARRDKSGHINRRLFIERFVLALGIYPVGLRLLGSSGLAAAPAQSGSGNIESADVKYPGDGATLQGYLSRPKGKGPFPGVIIVHHNLGLVEHFRGVSRRLASQGYAALAVDLLSRQGGTGAFATADTATKAFQNVKNEGVISDLDAAYQYLDSNSVVKKDDIAIMGFAAGAQKTFLYVTTNPKLKAAVIYYGSAPPDDQLARIQCPVLEIVGDKDTRFAPAVPVIQEKMKQLGKSYEWKIYPGADHDFFDDTDERYNEAAAKESWTVVLDFLKRNLG
jgi:carboxymethylenebutenolidase